MSRLMVSLKEPQGFPGASLCACVGSSFSLAAQLPG